MKNTLYLSATGITDFLSCPAKFKYRQDWKLKEFKDNLGLIVHRAMEEGKTPKEKQAATFYRELQELLFTERIKILEKEKKYQDEISNGVIFTRIIDAIGTRKSKKILIDYKTADWPWSKVAGRIPQSCSIQAAAYTLPLNGHDEKWPSELLFLVVNKQSRPEIYPYVRNGKDIDNLYDTIALIELANERKLWPHNRGKNCRYCDWAAVCFKTCGWRDLYVPRDRTEENAR